MKKLWILALILVAALAFTACACEDEPVPVEPAPIPVATPEPEPEITPDVEIDEPEATPEPVVEDEEENGEEEVEEANGEEEEPEEGEPAVEEEPEEDEPEEDEPADAGTDLVWMLGDFDYLHDWAPGWNTDGRSDQSYDLQIETLAAATHLVVVLSGELENDLEFVRMSAGNGWGWTQSPFWEPGDSLTIVRDLTRIREWDLVVSEGPAFIGLGGFGGNEDYLVEAFLILDPSYDGDATTRPHTPR